MDGGLLVAHYAPFDMGVLAKCLRGYQIAWKPEIAYACTCAMGRAAYPGLRNHRLNTLCGHVGIELNHHHAGSDSRAAAELLLNYINRGMNVTAYTRRYCLGG